MPEEVPEEIPKSRNESWIITIAIRVDQWVDHQEPGAKDIAADLLRDEMPDVLGYPYEVLSVVPIPDPAN